MAEKQSYSSHDGNVHLNSLSNDAKHGLEFLGK